MDDLQLIVVDKKLLPIFTELLEEDAIQRFSEEDVAIGALAKLEDSWAAAGILIGAFNDDFINLKWIYVREDLRRKGIGAKMLDFYMEQASLMPECNGVITILSEDEKDIADFLDSMDYIITDVPARRLYTARLSELEIPDIKQKDVFKDIHFLEDVPPESIRKYEKNLISADNDFSIGIKFPILPQNYDKESIVHTKGDSIDAMLLLNKTTACFDDKKEDGVNISWLYGTSSDPTVLAAVLSSTKQTLHDKYGEDVPITFTTLNDPSVDLGEKLFPESDFKTFKAAFFAFDDSE